MHENVSLSGDGQAASAMNTIHDPLIDLRAKRWKNIIGEYPKYMWGSVT